MTLPPEASNDAGGAASPAGEPRATHAAARLPATEAPAARLPDLAYQLYSQQFQQMSLLAVAAAGGALVMVQAGLFKVRPWTPVVAAIILALAALVAVIGSMELTRSVTEGKDVRKTLKGCTLLSFFLLGAGTGALVMGLLRNALA